mgnify:CR=1 FL=1
MKAKKLILTNLPYVLIGLAEMGAGEANEHIGQVSEYERFRFHRSSSFLITLARAAFAA